MCFVAHFTVFLIQFLYKRLDNNKDCQNLAFYKYITRQNKIANLLQNRGVGYMKILHFSSVFSLPSKHQRTSHYTNK